MTTSESKGRFFYKTNRFETIRTTNRIDSNRELECSRMHHILALSAKAGPHFTDPGGGGSKAELA